MTDDAARSAGPSRPVALKTALTTHQLDATRTFYERVLGLVVVEAWDEPGDRGVILGLPDGQHEALLELRAGERAGGGPSGISLQWKVADVQAFRATLPGDLAYEGPAPRPWGAMYLILRDPDGVEVVVYSGSW